MGNELTKGQTSRVLLLFPMGWVPSLAQLCPMGLLFLLWWCLEKYHSCSLLSLLEETGSHISLLRISVHHQPVKEAKRLWRVCLMAFYLTTGPFLSNPASGDADIVTKEQLGSAVLEKAAIGFEFIYSILSNWASGSRACELLLGPHLTSACFYQVLKILQGNIWKLFDGH